MPDQTIFPDDGERRSPTARHHAASVVPFHRPSGLPILATEPLTAAERDALRRAVRVVRLIGDRLEEACEANRVDQALWAASQGADAGQLLVDMAARLGSNR